MTLALRSASALVVLWKAALVLGFAQGTPPEPPASQAEYEQVAGNYKLANGQDVAVNLFTGDSGKTTLLYTNYETGIVRQLFPVSGDEYAAGLLQAGCRPRPTYVPFSQER